MGSVEQIGMARAWAQGNPITAEGPPPIGFDGHHGEQFTLGLFKDRAAFDGMPVWRVCYSKRNLLTGSPIPVMMLKDRTLVVDTLLSWLEGLGRPERQRVWRNNHHLCIDRSINGTEWETLSVDFHNAEPAPDPSMVAVISENWNSRPAAYPCENPTRLGDALLWMPMDCGQCGPCVDRATMETPRQLQRRKRAEKEAQGRVMGA